MDFSYYFVTKMVRNKYSSVLSIKATKNLPMSAVPKAGKKTRITKSVQSRTHHKEFQAVHEISGLLKALSEAQSEECRNRRNEDYRELKVKLVNLRV